MNDCQHARSNLSPYGIADRLRGTLVATSLNFLTPTIVDCKSRGLVSHGCFSCNVRVTSKQKVQPKTRGHGRLLDHRPLGEGMTTIVVQGNYERVMCLKAEGKSSAFTQAKDLVSAFCCTLSINILSLCFFFLKKKTYLCLLRRFSNNIILKHGLK